MRSQINKILFFWSSLWTCQIFDIGIGFNYMQGYFNVLDILYVFR